MQEGRSRLRKRYDGSKLFLVLLSLMLLTGLSFSGVGHTYAAYTTFAAAQDEARVAKFKVTMEGDQDHKELALDGINDTPSDAYRFKVTSESEVAVSADMSLSLNKALPPGVTMTFEECGTPEMATRSIAVPTPASESTAVIYNFKDFAYFDPTSGSTEKNFRLVFTGGKHGSITESASINFNLSVTMAQTDQGPEESSAAAE